MPHVPRRPPFWMIYSLLALACFVASQFIPVDTAVPVSNTLADPPKVTLDFLIETIRLITALNTALMSAAAALTVKGKDWGARWGYMDGLLVMLVFACCAASYYGIYLGHVAILGMVYKGTIYPFETGLQWAMGLEYYGTLAGVFILGLMFARMLEGRIDTEAGR